LAGFSAEPLPFTAGILALIEKILLLGLTCSLRLKQIINQWEQLLHMLFYIESVAAGSKIKFNPKV